MKWETYLGITLTAKVGWLNIFSLFEPLTGKRLDRGTFNPEKQEVRSK